MKNSLLAIAALSISVNALAIGTDEIRVSGIDPTKFRAIGLKVSGQAARDVMGFLPGALGDVAEPFSREHAKHFRSVMISSPGYGILISCQDSQVFVDDEGNPIYSNITPVCSLQVGKQDEFAAISRMKFDAQDACMGASGRGFIPGGEIKSGAAWSASTSIEGDTLEIGSSVKFYGPGASSFMALLPRVTSGMPEVAQHIRKLVLKSPKLALVFECRDSDVDAATGINKGPLASNTECAIRLSNASRDSLIGAGGWSFLRNRDACQK